LEAATIRRPPNNLTRDLFDRREPIYPAFPGSKGSSTSREAAEAIAPAASTWRGRVARLFADLHPRGLTADEAAKELNASPFLIRPRLSELIAAGLIEKTGERRRNPNSSPTPPSGEPGVCSARHRRSFPAVERDVDCKQASGRSQGHCARTDRCHVEDTGAAICWCFRLTRAAKEIDSTTRYVSRGLPTALLSDAYATPQRGGSSSGCDGEPTKSWSRCGVNRRDAARFYGPASIRS
jgi:hypothetical protein